jgi:D-3-phosphoglycerate dehydrogenase
VRIAVLDDYLRAIPTLPSFALLADHDVDVWDDHTDDVDVLAERLAPVEALVLIRERTRITAELLERLPNLRMISNRSDLPHIDLDACTRHGVTVCSDLTASTFPSFATAELTWALVLASMRRLPEQVASLRDGGWQTAMGRTLFLRRYGVYGYGRLGGVIAGYARAFGMQVQVWASEASRERAVADGFEVVSSKAELFETSDVLSVHLRLVDATRGIVTAEDLGRMHPTAVFVNTSRAGLVAPGALVEALRRGRPGMAAVDVFDHEPQGPGTPRDPLLDLDNVLATPHLGYVSLDDWDVMFRGAFEQVLAFAAGEPFNVVNPA